jgi:hypothetical protein
MQSMREKQKRTIFLVAFAVIGMVTFWVVVRRYLV